MQQIHKTFEARLVKLAKRRIREASLRDGQQEQAERVVSIATLRYIDRTNGAQTFLDRLEALIPSHSVAHLFRPPMRWKNLALEFGAAARADRRLSCNFDETIFDADLCEIRIRRGIKAELEEVIYDLELELEEEPEILAYYLKRREEDPTTGKQADAIYFCEFLPMRSAEPASGSLGEAIAGDAAFAADFRASMPPGSSISIVGPDGAESEIASVPALDEPTALSNSGMRGQIKPAEAGEGAEDGEL